MEIFIKGFVRPRVFDVVGEETQRAHWRESGRIWIMRVDGGKEGLDSVCDQYATFGLEFSPPELSGKC